VVAFGNKSKRGQHRRLVKLCRMVDRDIDQHAPRQRVIRPVGLTALDQGHQLRRRHVERPLDAIGKPTGWASRDQTWKRGLRTNTNGLLRLCEANM